MNWRRVSVYLKEGMTVVCRMWDFETRRLWLCSPPLTVLP